MKGIGRSSSTPSPEEDAKDQSDKNRDGYTYTRPIMAPSGSQSGCEEGLLPGFVGGEVFTEPVGVNVLLDSSEADIDGVANLIGLVIPIAVALASTCASELCHQIGTPSPTA